ncbi:MAG: hypothetical protein JOZ38_06180 [Candidatus Eremiobacteraeota bacterium]|nr:hypothetical protein [Candidatus Eremiobacteraeota bacterium]
MPVSTAGGAPLNLTLRALPTQNAIAQLRTAASLVGVSNGTSPLLPAVPPPSTGTTPGTQSGNAIVANAEAVSGPPGNPGQVPAAAVTAPVAAVAFAAVPDGLSYTTAFVGAVLPNLAVVAGTPTGGAPAPTQFGQVTFTLTSPPATVTSAQQLAQNVGTGTISTAPQSSPASTPTLNVSPYLYTLANFNKPGDPPPGSPPPTPPVTNSTSDASQQSQGSTATQTTQAAQTPPAPAAAATVGAPSAPAAPPQPAPTASPSRVAQYVSAVQNVLISLIYPAPIFSFSV